MLDAGLVVLLVLLGRARHILNGPPVVPVIDDRRAGRRDRPGQVGEGLQGLSGLADLLENAGVVPSGVVHHRAVELLKGAAAHAELEILHRVRAAGDSL